MPISEKMKTAWGNCQHCSKSTSEIVEILRDPEKWRELPIGNICGWKRICQVGFPRFGRKETWRKLCYQRANLNNFPSIFPYEQSNWVEDYCDVYKAVPDAPNNMSES